jgi:hypothetical protein
MSACLGETTVFGAAVDVSGKAALTSLKGTNQCESIGQQAQRTGFLFMGALRKIALFGNPGFAAIRLD